MNGIAPRSSTHWTLSFERYPLSALTTPSRASMSWRRYGRTMVSFVVPSVMAIAWAAPRSSIAAWNLTKSLDRSVGWESQRSKSFVPTPVESTLTFSRRFF